jgi:hypothetical protein
VTPEHREAKRRIQAAIKRWKCLVPPGVDIRHVFIESDAGDGSETTLAETKAQWDYHQATIKWYLPPAAGSTEEYINGTVVHELVHVLVDPMESKLRGKHDSICEHTVEGIARAILRTRKARRW